MLIYERCLVVLAADCSAENVYGHTGKTAAIDLIWNNRKCLFASYQAAEADEEKLQFLASLPFIGPITSLHLAKNLGADVAKNDVHMKRLATADRTTTAKLCLRLSKQTGYRVATIDTILWRACEQRILNSAVYEVSGWRAAFFKSRMARPDTAAVEQPTTD